MNMFRNFWIRPCFWSIILPWSFWPHNHKNSDRHCYDLIFIFCFFYKVIVMLHYLQVDASFWPTWLGAALTSLRQPIWSFHGGNDLIIQCGWPAPTSAWIDWRGCATSAPTSVERNYCHICTWFLGCWITAMMLVFIEIIRWMISTLLGLHSTSRP
jgi:hypothetical protein